MGHFNTLGPGLFSAFHVNINYLRPMNAVPSSIYSGDVCVYYIRHGLWDRCHACLKSWRIKRKTDDVIINVISLGLLLE